MALKDVFKSHFLLGAALSGWWLKNEDYRALVKREFSSVTCENEMKPQFTLDRAATLEHGSDERAALSFGFAGGTLALARDNGIKLRAHTLIWHNQTPRWFFAEGWSDEPEAPLVKREKMLCRMENLIRDTIQGINAVYPGLVYAWDVLNEFIEPDNAHPHGCRVRKNNWFTLLGEDVPLCAFGFARKYAPAGQKLFYNDYNEY